MSFPFFLLFLLYPGLTAGQTPAPEIELEEAYFREVAALDPEGAVEGYKKALADARQPSRARARACLRLGICYRLLGDLKGSRESFETVVKDYASETDVARLAERYLSERPPESPARFFPEDVLFYVELVDPKEHVRTLSELLRGTQFENPVNYYVSYLARQTAGGPEPTDSEGLASSSAEVLDAAAFLNEGFLREMQKIEGLALAVPGGGRLKESFLAVLLPGASDIMRGVAQMALTKSRARGAGKVADAPLFRLPPDRPGLLPEECIHAALGADIVCFGRPRSLVEDAMKRTASNAPSLAGDRDFQRAQSAREGSLVFTYLRKDAIASALRQSTPLEDRPLLDAALDAWGWGQIHALSLTLSRALSADALRLSLRARRDGAEGGLWNALSTPPIDPDVLRSVPPASLAFFAVRLDRVPDRVELFSSALAPVLDAAPAAGGAAKKDGVEKLREFFEAGAGKAFLEKLDSVVLGLHPVSQEPSALSLFLLLVFTEPSGGPALFEDAFTAFCGSAFGTLAGRKFEPEMLQWNGKQAAVRSIEPIPGHRIRCVQLGKFLAVTASPEILSELEKTLGSKGASPVIPLPSRTAKALFARPAALLSASRKPSGIPPQLEALLSQVERVLLTTREGKESISIDLSIPDVKKTVRSMLSKIAAVKPSGKE